MASLTGMLQRLPPETICEIFVRLESPHDYFCLSTTCRDLHALGSVHLCKTRFLMAYFIDKHTAQHQPWMRICCDLVASSGVKPIKRSLTATAQQISSRTFCSYFLQQSDKGAQRALLDLFHDGCQEGPWTVPSLACCAGTSGLLASAHWEARHLTQDGPRRVFYDATLYDNESMQHFYCVFHLIDTMVAFQEHPHGFSMRQGRVVYRDEDICDTTAWTNIFQPEKTIVMTVQQQSPSFPRRSMLVPDNWEPSILRTYTGCRLSAAVHKSAIKVGDWIERVEMSEHSASDMIRLAFYDAKSCIKGFLLLSEDRILWD